MTSDPVYELFPATAPEVPLVVSVPHTGTAVPDGIRERFRSPTVAALPDTDWHLHRLYDFVPELGATLITARFSRYVVDLNRPADQHALYPGRDETGLVPRSTFGEEAIYRDGTEPDDAEVAARRERYWDPYHRLLREQLDAVKERFGFALLWDAHSIPSVVPRFFDGELPELMLGDVGGTSCDPRVSAAVRDAIHRTGLSHRENDPFQGGWITRSFGAPASGVHALQLEMSQRIYMVEGQPFAWDGARAAAFRPVLVDLLRAFVDAGMRLFGDD